MEVTLVDVKKNDHLYILTNKSVKSSSTETQDIFRGTRRNTLYFRLTDEDFNNGYKT